MFVFWICWRLKLYDKFFWSFCHLVDRHGHPKNVPKKYKVIFWRLTCLPLKRSFTKLFRISISITTLLENVDFLFLTLLTTNLRAFFKGVFRTLWNIWDGAFCKNSKHMEADIVFAKCFILDIWQGSEYPYGFGPKTI